jgi:hypothetical protein
LKSFSGELTFVRFYALHRFTLDSLRGFLKGSGLVPAGCEFGFDLGIIKELLIGDKVQLRMRHSFLIRNCSLVQVNLCQKFLFLHQLTHNMTTDCSLNYKINT